MSLHRAVGKSAAASLQNRAVRLLCVLEVSELLLPVVTLIMQRLRQIQKGRIASPVVEPENTDELIMPTIFAPILQGLLRQFAGLKGKIALHQRNHSRIARGLLILSQGFEHDHPRPPVLICEGTDGAIRALVS